MFFLPLWKWGFYCGPQVILSYEVKAAETCLSQETAAAMCVCQCRDGVLVCVCARARVCMWFEAALPSDVIPGVGCS